MQKIWWTIFCLCVLVSLANAGNPPAYGDLRDSVDLQLHTVRQTLIASHPTIAYLEVVNNSLDSLDLTLTWQKPDFLDITSAVTHHVLSPKNSFVFTEHLEVASRIQPGASQVLYQLTIVYSKNGRQTQTSKVITQDVELGILGESGIMTVLGLNVFSIPFFLVLPGFLFLVIWSSFRPKKLCWRRKKKSPSSGSPPLPSRWYCRSCTLLFPGNRFG